MANRDSSTNEPAIATACGPLHVPFTWLNSNIANDANALFAADVKNVTHGGWTIAELIRSESLAPDHGERQILSAGDLDSLVGLLIYSMQSLNEAAEKHIDWLETVASKGAAK